jgi:hypothetical protein
MLWKFSLELRDTFTEIAVLKVFRGFLRMIQSADYPAVMTDLRDGRWWDPSEGEYAMILTPSFLAVFMCRIASPSMSKVNGECSTSMAAMGRGACALRRAEAKILEGPGCLTFSALERMGALIQSSNGYPLDELGHLSNSAFDWDHEVGTVEVVRVNIINCQPRQGLVEGSSSWHP